MDCYLIFCWKERFVVVWNFFYYMLILFMVYFGEYIIFLVILIMLVFKDVGEGFEFVFWGYFEYYVLSIMVGEFLG